MCTFFENFDVCGVFCFKTLKNFKKRGINVMNDDRIYITTIAITLQLKIVKMRLNALE